MIRILNRAGLAPWPKLFTSLRSTRLTELSEQYPVHVVTTWLGNSPPVAAKHYLQATEAYFERAAVKWKDQGRLTLSQASWGGDSAVTPEL